MLPTTHTRSLQSTRVLLALAATALLLAALGGRALLLSGDGPLSAPLGSLGLRAPAPEVGTLLSWTSRGLTAGYPEQAAAVEGVEAVSVISGDNLQLVASWEDGVRVDEPPAGHVIPLDAVAFDPGAMARLAPDGDLDEIRNLVPGEALLSETGAALRGLGPGAVIEMATGARVQVAAVVTDEAILHAELAVPLHGADRLGITTPRAMLVGYTGDRAAVEDRLRRAVPGGDPARVKAPGEIPYFRHGGTVLPQTVVKERFGEFSYAAGQGRGFVQDDAWVEANLVAARVPIVGEVVCHRAVLPAVRGALEEIERAGLAHTIDPRQYAGCWGPRLIGEGHGVSRHAWGIAIDFNAVDNPLGAPSRQDPRLVEVMRRWGFIWGGDWLLEDAMHFEIMADGP